ncbi:hypothetical protein CkaCkLH20_00008 [Colletotrichum karsti]|uniref:Uncharacterized protein n=1 Tax=Colletotrichum karsti TaxID=1095194 RepID=A0A9P6LR62_9PEZI|nr:uncharacterized protein CkaCkLH20_00008 [Colletotrichum karsti]KAF9881972.1 hypothetical protein CkaCkLH20_00008 [Colletotrichum karsti]
MASILLQNGTYSINETSLAEASRMLDYSASDPIQDLSSFNGSGILQQIVECTRASCHEDEQGNQVETDYGVCGQEIAKLPARYEEGDDLGSILDPLKSLCSSVKGDPEADIVGPGVTVSYIIQFALGAWFFVFSIFIPRDPSSNIYLKLTSCLHRTKRKIWKDSLPTRKDSEKTRTESFLERLCASRFSVALFSSFVEFQEAQAFFTIAIQLASISLVVFNEHVPDLDWDAARHLSSGNALVVLMVQTELHRRKLHWWYTYLLAVTVCVLGLVIREMGDRLRKEGYVPLSQCGGHRESILETCRISPNMFADDSLGSDPYFRIPLIGFILLSIDQLVNIPSLRAKMVGWMETSKKGSRPLKWAFGFISIVWSLIWFVVNFLVWYLLLSNVETVLTAAYGSMNKKDEWTFGQVVAVLPWAPVVAKYIYYSIFGIKDGVSSRIDNHYKVVSNDSKRSSSKPPPQSEDEIELRGKGYQSVSGREDVTPGEPSPAEWGRPSPADAGRYGDESSYSSSLQPQRFAFPSPSPQCNR